MRDGSFCAFVCPDDLFMVNDLTLNFINHEVDGCIHVFACLVGVKTIAACVKINLSGVQSMILTAQHDLTVKRLT